MNKEKNKLVLDKWWTLTLPPPPKYLKFKLEYKEGNIGGVGKLIITDIRKSKPAEARKC